MSTPDVTKILGDLKTTVEKKINEIGEKGYITGEEVEAKIKEGVDKIDAKINELQKDFAKKAISVPGVNEEKEKFSFHKAAIGMMTGDWSQSGFEKEVFDNTKQRVTSVNGGNNVGYWIPMEVSNEYIDLALASMPLYDKITKIPNVVGDFSIPVLLTRPDGDHVAESGTSTEVDYTWGDRRFSPKRASGFTKISNQALLQTAGSMEAIIAGQLQKSMRVEVHKAMVSGTGTSSKPLGIENYSGFTTTTASGSTRFTAEQAEIMRSDIEESGDHDTMEGNYCYLMRPKIASRMKLERIAQYSGDTAGEYVYSPPLLSDSALENLIGFPFLKSTHCTQSGTSSTVVFGDFSEMMMATWQGMKLRTSREAGDGTSSAFLKDELWLIIDMYYDLNVGDRSKFCKITDAALS